MRKDQDSAVEALVEQLIEGGSENMATVFAGLFNLAMRIERERFLGAGHYERTPERRGYANGTRPKKIDTPAGTVRLEVPKTAGHEAPFYPQALERGRRSCRAVMLAVAEMYIKGVSTRDAEAVMREFGLESLSSSQVSRAAKLLDGELDAWRNRPLGEIRYLLLDARYEKVREGGVVRDAAVLSVIGIGPDQRRRVLGVSCALSEAEVHWRAFLETLVARGMRGVAYIVSDDHPGLGAARKAVLGGAVWQRCQYHLAQNAIHHAPNLAIRKAIGKELRRVWNAADGKAAEAELGHLVAAYRDSAPKLADWLETAIPEGLAVFALPERHQKRMRTSSPMERSIQQEIKRRTVKVRVFPNEASLERLVTAILVEIDEKWETTENPTSLGKQRNPTSLGKQRMTDQRRSEFPHIRLLNHVAGNRTAVMTDPSGLHGALASAKREGVSHVSDEARGEMRAFHADFRLEAPEIMDFVEEFDSPWSVTMQTIWPNLIVQREMNTLGVRQIVPRGPHEFAMHWTMFGFQGDDDAMRRHRLRQGNLMGPAGFLGMEDNEAMKFVQDGMKRSLPGGHVVAMEPEIEAGGTDCVISEAAIRAMYKSWREIMGIGQAGETRP